MDSSLFEPSLETVKAILILDNNGDRIVSQYFNDPLHTSYKDQRTFEEKIFKKTKKSDSEIILLDHMTVVYRSSIDLLFYVIGSVNENELMLMGLLNTLFESLNLVLKRNLEKKAIVTSLNVVLMILDEICNGGVILECDSNLVAQRVTVSRHEESTYKEILSEQSIGSVLQTAKETLKRSILSS
ncbi:Coatomer subunit zeta-1-like isoform X5 [Oopsacas minuta]|uniref:Coatomer subunit zeta n=1 Tax=Oopsacas minuta TaxID=111878 RepID=A0AAV7JZM4_9METZ|nr:Coatomer subunit zeta-1-like isoform X5 [Oopsacas minuta]